MPWPTPPWIWPSRSIGLSTVPASSQATWRRWRTLPVSVSTSTTATWAPNGNVGARGGEVGVEHQAAVGLGRDGQLGPGLGDRGRAGDVEGAGVLVEHDVGDVGLEQLGGEALGVLDEFLGRLVDRGAALLERARAHGAAALRDEVGVAPDRARSCPSGCRSARRRSSPTPSCGPARGARCRCRPCSHRRRAPRSWRAHPSAARRR